ncbi:MAG: VOC family protein [Deltaproteobacteria bacterium]|nr:VOC family protein [Deltaproteobacteria bacterium]
MKILGLDHVVIRVQDLEASLRFYCEALGCSEERRLDELGLVQLRAGDALIDLVPVDSPLGRAGGAAPDPKAPNVDHFALRIESFDKATLAAHLRSHSVEPGEVSERYGAEGSGPSMYIRDPDGNAVELKGPTSARESST